MKSSPNKAKAVADVMVFKVEAGATPKFSFPPNIKAPVSAFKTEKETEAYFNCSSEANLLKATFNFSIKVWAFPGVIAMSKNKNRITFFIVAK